jgi:hypothetical protein
MKLEPSLKPSKEILKEIPTFLLSVILPNTFLFIFRVQSDFF